MTVAAVAIGASLITVGAVALTVDINRLVASRDTLQADVNAAAIAAVQSVNAPGIRAITIRNQACEILAPRVRAPVRPLYPLSYGHHC